MVAEGASAQAAPVTRGFLFADLRDYTAFTEAHGDNEARRLLGAYRQLVRRVVGEFGGAEIKTEGDSFYVVFPSATAAVKCGLALVEAAAEATRDQPKLPVKVGVGVHAGETADSAEGYVGSAVNVAARLCSAAAAGEVLVSDVVRALTRTSGEVHYTARGNRRFKGISEPMAVFAATRAIGAARLQTQPRSFARSRGLLGAAVAATALLVVVAVVLATSGTPSPTGTIQATSTRAAGVSPITPTFVAGGASRSPAASGSISEMPFVDPVASAGRYRLSTFFGAPDLATDGSWQLGYCISSAPTGTCPYKYGYDANLADLRRADRPQSQLVIFHATELLSDPCATGPVQTIGPGESFLHWLRTQPALHVTEPIQLVFPSFRANQLDVTVGAGDSPAPTGAATPCPFTDPDSVAMKRYGTSPPLALNEGDRIRVLAFDSPSNVLAFLIAPNQQEFDILEPQAQELLKTLHFPQQ